MDWEEHKNKNACARVHNILERMFPAGFWCFNSERKTKIINQGQTVIIGKDYIDNLYYQYSRI